MSPYCEYTKSITFIPGYYKTEHQANQSNSQEVSCIQILLKFYALIEINLY
jgi:hypothetical protein